MEDVDNLLSMKFMIANVGPRLSTLLKVSKLILPSLKAIIVKALSDKNIKYVKNLPFISNSSNV